MADPRVEHGHATKVFNNAHDCMHQARRDLHQIQDCATQMTSHAWLGVASQTFAQNIQHAHDELSGLCTQIEHLIEHGKTSVTAFVNHDAGN
jgi:uncharacterized protein YukE